MTAREQLLAAKRAVDDALLFRCEVITQLRNDGFTTRQIAAVLGVSASTVVRWGPLPDDVDGPRLSLDEDWSPSPPLNQPRNRTEDAP